MIRIADHPSVNTLHKTGYTTEWKNTHDFKDKRILPIGVPGSFIVEYVCSNAHL